jgi:hypothetical protein
MKKRNIKAKIELLNKTYLIEELFTYNGETKHLYYEEGKPNDVIYRPMAGSVSNCLSSLTQIYLKRVSVMDRVIGIDKNIVMALKSLGFLDKNNEWIAENPPKELDVFTILLYNRLSRRVKEEELKEQKLEIEKKVVVQSQNPKFGDTEVVKINPNLLDNKSKIRRLTEELLNLGDQKIVESLENFLTHELFLNYKEKLYSDLLK